MILAVNNIKPINYQNNFIKIYTLFVFTLCLLSDNNKPGVITPNNKFNYQNN